MMTRQDFRAIAAAIHRAAESAALIEDLSECRAAASSLLSMAEGIADVLAASNPRFDRSRFMLAAGFAAMVGA